MKKQITLKFRTQVQLENAIARLAQAGVIDFANEFGTFDILLYEEDAKRVFPERFVRYKKDYSVFWGIAILLALLLISVLLYIMSFFFSFVTK
ncbi:MAG TPA: hypothetical protein PKD70_11215 [Saprospiraceae bacterium]|nr:hypothetical protein [Saprospiraceae bacterium]HMP14441.1 hypothetical protein [Saprospiraceae bacterium]